MQYRLSLITEEQETRRDIGENIFFDNLPFDYQVYLFYYPGAMPDDVLEDKLKKLGELTGKNLLVNIGRLNDPNFDKMASAFEITQLPVLIMTANRQLAAIRHNNGPISAYVRIDSKDFIKSPRVLECVEKLFAMFLTGKIVEALSEAKADRRADIISRIRHVILDGLKALAKYISDKDISVSILEGKFEIRKNS
jgi:hypothetical protein